jgi:hypothetical protein
VGQVRAEGEGEGEGYLSYHTIQDNGTGYRDRVEMEMHLDTDGDNLAYWLGHNITYTG